MNATWPLGAALLWLGWAAAGLGAQQLTYIGGISYAGGTYIFDRRTDAVYVSNGLRLAVGGFEVSASVPLIAQNGGVISLVGGGVPLPTGGADHGVVSRRRGGGAMGTRREGGGGQADADSVAFRDDFETHVGDPFASVSGELYSGLGALRSLRVTGSVKAPLNDVDSGVGSGAWDYGLGASVTAGASSVLVFLDASYWWVGDMPELVLEDALSYGVGAGVSLGRSSLLITLAGMSRTIESADPALSLAASLGRSVGARGFLSGGVGLGLTESSPTVTAILSWSVRM